MENFLQQLHKKDKFKDITIDCLKQIHKLYPVKISSHLQTLILSGVSEGVYRQFMPNIYELDDDDGVGAFFDDEIHYTKTMVKKYPNRCIIYTTSKCFANCRHCSRKENWKDNQEYSEYDFDEAYLNILHKPYIEEVIITGGDALTLPVDRINYMINKLINISHVKVIRIGTRAFTSNPKAVSTNFCDMLSQYKSVVVSTQFNHADEFTDETEEAIYNVQRTGTIILNQSTLLKNVNDDYETMKELLNKCTQNRVVPYYLFHCFKVKGTQCFRTKVETGTNIINQLVGNVGGWWIPRYTLIPHTTGVKIPICQNGIISTDNESLLVKDYRNRIIMYE